MAKNKIKRKSLREYRHDPRYDDDNGSLQEQREILKRSEKNDNPFNELFTPPKSHSNGGNNAEG